MATLAARATHKLEMVRAVRSQVANWYVVLPRIARSQVEARVGARRQREAGELVTRFRDGVSVVTPATMEAWWPVCENLCTDVYRLADLGIGLGRGDVVVDVGAHVGDTALAFDRLWPGVRVECYEPNPDALGYLRRNVHENRVDAGIYGEAVGATSGHITLWREPNAGCRASTAVKVSGDGLEVPVTAFDDVVARAAGPIRLVKLDCEGAEHEIVRGSKDESWADVRAVVLEYDPPDGGGGTWETLRERFDDLGFEVVWHVADLYGPDNGQAALVRRA
jgi:FkbM family methyltransferase